eukprot:10011720-Alexandrium_andersonii.AAC.1
MLAKRSPIDAVFFICEATGPNLWRGWGTLLTAATPDLASAALQIPAACIPLSESRWTRHLGIRTPTMTMNRPAK